MIYVINQCGTNNYKIGYTGDRPEKRLAALQTGNPNKLSLCGYIDGGYQKESEIHAMFDNFRLQGEWFRIPHPQQIYQLIVENNGTYVKMNPLEEENFALKTKNAELQEANLKLKEQLLEFSLQLHKLPLEEDGFICEKIKRIKKIYEALDLENEKTAMLKPLLAMFIMYEKEEQSTVKFSYRKMAKIFGITERTVGKLIKRLNQLGLITIMSEPHQETEIKVKL